MQNVNKAKYNFSADPAFVRVEISLNNIKVLHTKTMPAQAFRSSYGISNYGAVRNGTVIYVLETDYNYYTKNNVSGIGMTTIAPEPVAVPAAVETSPKKEPKVTDVLGIGAAGSAKLYEMGYTTVRELETLTLDDWTNISAFNTAETYVKMLDSVEQLLQ